MCKSCGDDEKHYYDKLTKKCEACTDTYGASCVTCNGEQCLNCGDDSLHYWDVSTGKCEACSGPKWGQACELCEGWGCTKCSDGSWGDKGVCKACSDTYGASCTLCDSFECKDCGGKIADNCKSHISDIKCTCNICEDNYEKCSGRCADLTSDPSNCGTCGNACHFNSINDGGLVFAQQCVNSVCKCTNSAQCPDDTPICNTSTGECVKCSYTGVQGLHLPCATRANTLKSTKFECDYPEAEHGSGTGKCVECNLKTTADDTDCAFLIDHSTAGQVAKLLKDIPTITADKTYCGADNTCQPLCPAIANCAEPSTDCKCTKCNTYFTVDGDGASCKCTLTGDNCKTKNGDQCSCKECKNGYKDNSAGGCEQCPTIANCDTYDKDCKCTACDSGLTVCGGKCVDTNADSTNCGGCDNACHSNTQPVDGGLVFTQQCVDSVCKCTDSAECPDDAPICDTKTGTCAECVPNGILHWPCATRANTLKNIQFQCGTGKCVECTAEDSVNDNNCAFLIDHSKAGAEVAKLLKDIPTITAAYTYCAVDSTCQAPRVCDLDKVGVDKCGTNCECPSGRTCCSGVCKDLQIDEKNCGACDNACHSNTQPVDGGLAFTQQCTAGTCKCTDSAECPDDTPICNAKGECVKCSFNGDKGLPCATRAVALKITQFQCDYPEAEYGSGTGKCVECNMENRAGDNDCAFLIKHSTAGAEAAELLKDIPTIDNTKTYCAADSTCQAPCTTTYGPSCLKCDSSKCLDCGAGNYYDSTAKKCQTCTAKYGASCTSCDGSQCLGCGGKEVANCNNFVSDDNKCTCDTCTTGYEKCNSGGACVNLSTDINNCGSCGKACSAGNICQGGTCMCPATGTCTVTSIIPVVINVAPPFPYKQWFEYRKTGPTPQMVPVSLASEVSAGAPLTLNTNPPGGITGALKLVTLADHIAGPPQVEGDRAHAAIFFPPAKYSSTPGIPTEGGLFDGVLFKDFATDSSTHISYDWYRVLVTTSNSAAPTLRLVLRSPAFDAANPGTSPNHVHLVYEPYYQPATGSPPPYDTWMKEDITAAYGSSTPVPTTNGNAGGGFWVYECKLLNYGGTEVCGAVVRSLETIANYYATQAPTFMNDAYIVGVAMVLSNANSKGYANNIEVSYGGKTVKWLFEAAA